MEKKKRFRVLDEIGFIGTDKRTLNEVNADIALTVSYINKQKAQKDDKVPFSKTKAVVS